jgi:hypothetical protein
MASRLGLTLADRRAEASRRVLVSLTTGLVPSLAGSFWLEGWERALDVSMLDRRTVRGPRALARLLREAGRFDAIVLDGSIGLRAGYLDLLATAAISRGRKPPAIVLTECAWKRGSWWLDRAACRAGIRAVDAPTVTYCVLSSDELRLFPETWHVEAERVAFTPYCFTLSDAELAGPISEDGGVFSGGDSLRDYDPLVAASSVLSVDVTIAARSDRIVRRGSLPPNLRVGPLPHSRFVDSMRRAAVVVVPLKSRAERSAGQQTYLNAMALGKPVVVTDAPGVRDHVDHGATGLIVPPGDPVALRDTLAWVLDPGNRKMVDAMRARAQRIAIDRFGPERYLQRVLQVTHDALERLGG